MKQKFFTCIFLLLPITLNSFIVLTSANDDDSWMDPDAWAGDHFSLNSLQSATGKCCKCLQDEGEDQNSEDSQHGLCKNAEDAASITYFKKFISMLFNRKYLKYESTSQIYERLVLFTLQPSQLEKLEQLQDPRDLDNILTEIFENVHIPNIYTDGQQHHTGFVSSLFQIFYNALKLTKMSEIRFVLVVIAVILIANIIKKRFRTSLLTLICGGIFTYGYLHTYLECNREMKVNEMLEIMKRAKGEEKSGVNDLLIVKFIKDIFSKGDVEDLEHEMLRKSAKLSLGFCRPDHVLIMYFNDIFLKYLQVLLEQCTATLKTLNQGLSFPYNIISGPILIYAICYILKLTFKYFLSPAGWMQFAHRKHYEPDVTALTNTQSTQNEDRISGENLKLLLNVITGASHQKTTPPKLAVSGVQEVKEAIEECSSQSKSQNKEHNSVVEASANNNSVTKLNDSNTDVTLEDVPDDVS